MADKTCFITMPITTPAEEAPNYNNDKDHFKHVLEEIFIPAIMEAGYIPISPVTKGAEIIHDDIINNLEKSDLVLADMSILNANVFFEMGIRTALNKPIIIVADDKIQRIPFDQRILNYHIYNSDLASYIVKTEIEKISSHIRESATKNRGRNSLWSHFGGKTSTEPPRDTSGRDIELAKLSKETSNLSDKVTTLAQYLSTGNLKDIDFLKDNSSRGHIKIITQDIMELLENDKNEVLIKSKLDPNDVLLNKKIDHVEVIFNPDIVNKGVLYEIIDVLQSRKIAIQGKDITK